MEVVHVYLCPECGFMHHGRWLYSLEEHDLDGIETAVKEMLHYKYCPLCSCKKILSEAFILPQLDPDSLQDLVSEVILVS